MMKNIFYTLLTIIILSSCQSSDEAVIEAQEYATIAQAQAKEAQAQVEKAQATIDSLVKANDTGIIHTIYLTTKPDLSDEDKAKFITTVESLGQIEQVKSIEVAERLNVGDEERALTKYNIILQMRFDNLEDLKIYDKDEFHAQVRGQLKEYLAGPPASFDFEL